MNFKQWILLIVGTGMVVILYALPRTVLKKPDPEPESIAESKKETNNSSDHPDFSKKHASTTDNLKVEYRKSGDLSVLDKIISVYTEGFAYDSAAKYAEIRLNAKPTAENTKELAAIYYEKFMTALNEADAVKFSEKARTLYLKASQSLNEDDKAKLAMTYTTTETPMKGITMLREIVQGNPNHELSINNLGLLAMKSGQFEKAKDRFLKLSKDHPDNLTYSYYLGICYAQLADQKSAVIEFKKIAGNAKDPVLKQSAEQMLNQLK